MAFNRGFAAVALLALGCVASVYAGADAPVPHGGSYQPYPQYYAEPQYPLDFLDKLYEKLDDLRCELKTAREQIGTIAAQMSLLVKICDELSKVILEDLEQTNRTQNQLLNSLADHLDHLNDTLDDVRDTVLNVSSANEANTQDFYAWAALFFHTLHIDIENDGEIARLEVLTKDFKEKLFQVFGNEFKLFSNDVEDVSSQLKSVGDCERKRMCETGVVSLDADDRRAEYLFQAEMPSVPQVFYGLSCFGFGLDARSSPAPSYGSYYPWQEPNALGVFVTATPSRTGVTFEKFNLAFGDSVNQKACVTFQACTLSSGTELHS